MPSAESGLIFIAFAHGTVFQMCLTALHGVLVHGHADDGGIAGHLVHDGQQNAFHHAAQTTGTGVVEKVQEELLRHYAPTTPVAACYKLTWKDERIYRGQLKDLAKIVKENHLTLTTLLVVGDAIDNRKGLSRLYADEFKHLFRK